MSRAAAWLAVLAGILIAVAQLASEAPSTTTAPGRRRLFQRLSETGVFRDVVTLQPGDGVVPFELNVTHWSDGATKRRWIILPGDGSSPDPTKDRIIIKPGVPWAFPVGSIFVEHLDWEFDPLSPAPGRRVETRVLVRDTEGGVYGVSYKWNAEGTEADLLEKDEVATLTARKADGSVRELEWNYPGPAQCTMCHNRVAGGVLGVNYRQINRSIRYADRTTTVNQLVAWNRAGMLSKSVDQPKALDVWNLVRVPDSIPVPFWNAARQGELTPPSDRTRDLASRARSYLDANCAHCHAPGIVNADWDARSTTPLGQQGLIGARARIARNGVEQIVAPGNPEQSLIYLRVATNDPAVRMPPIGRTVIDEAGAQILAEWIRSMASTGPHATSQRR